MVLLLWKTGNFLNNYTMLCNPAAVPLSLCINAHSSLLCSSPSQERAQTSSVGEWFNQLYCFRTMKYDSVITRNEFAIHTTQAYLQRINAEGKSDSPNTI